MRNKIESLTSTDLKLYNERNKTKGLVVQPKKWEEYTEEELKRFDVRPGITGWAQVNGRNMCKMSKKFEYDVWYVDHISCILDIKILWLTIMNVLKRSDIGIGAGNMKDVDDVGFMDRLR